MDTDVLQNLCIMALALLLWVNYRILHRVMALVKQNRELVEANGKLVSQAMATVREFNSYYNR